MLVSKNDDRIELLLRREVEVGVTDFPDEAAKAIFA